MVNNANNIGGGEERGKGIIHFCLVTTPLDVDNAVYIILSNFLRDK